jgi:single-stranded DNA-binding protein
MLNQVVLVGRIWNLINLELDGNCTITLKVTKSTKNSNNEYDYDYIDVTLTGDVAQKTRDYCKEGDLVGIKGHLRKNENDFHMTVEAEKITFLSGTKGGE